MHLLGATEKLVCVTYPTLISKIPAILNAYYSSDIVDEPVFVEWAAAAETEYLSAKKHKSVVENAAQFMEWLKVRRGCAYMRCSLPGGGRWEELGVRPTFIFSLNRAFGLCSHDPFILWYRLLT